MQFYASVDNPNNIKIKVGFVLVLLFSFLISFVYGLVMAVSPLVYINIIITVIFGLMLGFGVQIITKLMHITQKKTALIMALVGGSLSLYLSWIAYILFLTSPTDLIASYFNNLLLTFKPVLIWGIISEINTTGAWEIFGIPFNGWTLGLIWFMEGVMIIAIPWLFIKRQPESPYSIKKNKWYAKYALNRDFESIPNTNEFRQNLSNAPENTIANLNFGKANHFSRISIYYLEDESDQFISVHNMHRDKDGKNETKTEVVHLLKINGDEADVLIKKYKGKRKIFLL